METINEIIDESCRKFGKNAALGFAMGDKLSYEQVYEQVLKTAVYLKKIGVGPGTHVAILAENSPGWGIAYFSIVRLGAVVVPILPDFLESDILHVMEEADVKFIFTSGRLVENIVEDSSRFKKIIYLDSGTMKLDQSVTLESIVSGAEPQATEIAQAALAGNSVNKDDLASILYTSGTSGHSKAVMLTHGNFAANLNSANQLIPIRPDWTFLSILPISHAYEFTIGFLLPLRNGAQIVYSQSRPTPTILGKICQSERPEVMCVVPMVMEKIYKKRVLPKIEKSWLLKIALKVPVLKEVVLSKIGGKLLEFFGGNLQLLAIGGAAINFEAENFLKKAGFPYLVGYGLSEAAPLLSGGPFEDEVIAVGSSGKPIPGVEIKIHRPDTKSGIGEILARGPNVMKGYYKAPELTEETIDEDGWLLTGDLGLIDELGNLHIKGRSKNVIVLASGENIYPEAIEEKINSMPLISESLVVENDGRLEALMYPDYDLIDQHTKGMGADEIKQYIQKSLKQIQMEVNGQLPGYSKINVVSERTEPFIKTATHKIKRYLYVTS